MERDANIHGVLLRGLAAVQESAPKLGIRRPLILSERQKEVWQLLAQGLTVKQTASTLEIPENTVKSRRTKLYARLGVHSNTEIIIESVNGDFLQPEEIELRRVDKLSAREREVLNFMADNQTSSTESVAKGLKLSKNTIKTHLKK